MLTRREFLKLSALTGAGLALPLDLLANASPVLAFSQSDALRKFVQPLRMVGADIPVAAPDTTPQPWWQPGVTHYTMDIGQFEDQLHPDLPNPTRLWGFGQNGNFKHLAGVIATKRGAPVQITFRNNLPPDHIIPVDDTIMGVMGNQNNRANIHLHGGLVPWTSDGGPMAWFDPNGHKGPSFLNNQVLNPGAAQNEAEYYYHNGQGSRVLWYHDHSFGTTRINAYAGMASAYVIYDDYELSLGKTHNLPGPLDPRTIYLVFQDKIFVRNDIAQLDPTWPSIMPNSRPGDLWYAHEYDPDRWELSGSNPPADPSVIPEFFADTMLVNGSVFPFLEVEQRQYRFRMLNACNARFLNPKLLFAKGKSFPDNTEPNLKVPGPWFVQFGSEGGFQPYPSILRGTTNSRLLLAPAERCDLIVDFRFVPAGTTLILYNDAAAPYPMGDPINDYFPGNSSTPTAAPGFGPNTRTLMQIKVKARSTRRPDPPITLPLALHPTDPFLVKQIPTRPNPIPKGVKVRYLTLNEDFDEFGRLIQRLGTSDPVGPSQFGRAYTDDPTEVIPAGSTEVWEIINLTGDVHPMHFHLVNVQVLSRQNFDVVNYAGGVPTYQGKPIAPDINELGWKETVRNYPNQVTRVLMKFDLPAVPFTVPASPRTGGNEYVWHCHILEHEEHDMMRPLIIV
jgi:spore coat protein A, manganese oxidase